MAMFYLSNWKWLFGCELQCGGGWFLGTDEDRVELGTSRGSACVTPAENKVGTFPLGESYGAGDPAWQQRNMG